MLELGACDYPFQEMKNRNGQLKHRHERQRRRALTKPGSERALGQPDPLPCTPGTVGHAQLMATGHAAASPAPARRPGSAKSCHPRLPFISLPRGKVFSHQVYLCRCGDVFFSPVTHRDSLVPRRGKGQVCRRLPRRQRDVNQLGIAHGLRKIRGKTTSW